MPIKILKYINITETNSSTKVASIVVTENVGIDAKKTKYNGNDKREDPWWKK